MNADHATAAGRATSAREGARARHPAEPYLWCDAVWPRKHPVDRRARVEATKPKDVLGTVGLGLSCWDVPRSMASNGGDEQEAKNKARAHAATPLHCCYCFCLPTFWFGQEQVAHPPLL